MNVGAMNRWLIFRSRNATTGEYVDEVLVKGSLSFVGGRDETLMSGAPLAIAQWKVVTRYRTDIKAEWQIEDKETGNVFQISSYGDPDGHRRQLDIVCVEVQ